MLMNCWWKCKLAEPLWKLLHRSKTEYMHTAYATSPSLGVNSGLYRNIRKCSICEKVKPTNAYEQYKG